MVRRFSRMLSLGALFISASAGSLLGRGLRVDSVAIEPHDSGDFAGISQYFRGHGTKFRHGLYRSDWSREDGLYVVVFLNEVLGNYSGDLSVSFEFLLAGNPKIYKVGCEINKGCSSK